MVSNSRAERLVGRDIRHTTPAAVRVAVIADHEVMRAGIQAWCAQEEPPITVAYSAETALEYFAHYPDLPNREIDVVVFDLDSGGGRPDWNTLRKMCTAGERVIVYSHFVSDEVILNSLDIGAVTYLVKTEGRQDFIDSVHAAQSGEPYVGPRMAKALLTDKSLGRTRLSEREREVLVAWFQTESKDLVAKRLFIAPTTVRTHLQRARAKYAAVGRRAPTKSALLARAVEDGILGLNEL